jgi:hypothetical protein
VALRAEVGRALVGARALRSRGLVLPMKNRRKMGFRCSCSSFRAAALALQGDLACTLGTGLGSVRPIDRLF